MFLEVLASDQREINVVLKNCETKGFMRDVKWIYWDLYMFSLAYSVELVPNWLAAAED